VRSQSNQCKNLKLCHNITSKSRMHEKCCNSLACRVCQGLVFSKTELYVMVTDKARKLEKEKNFRSSSLCEKRKESSKMPRRKQMQRKMEQKEMLPTW